MVMDCYGNSLSYNIQGIWLQGQGQKSICSKDFSDGKLYHCVTKSVNTFEVLQILCQVCKLDYQVRRISGCTEESDPMMI